MGNLVSHWVEKNKYFSIAITHMIVGKYNKEKKKRAVDKKKPSRREERRAQRHAKSGDPVS